MVGQPERTPHAPGPGSGGDQIYETDLLINAVLNCSMQVVGWYEARHCCTPRRCQVSASIYGVAGQTRGDVVIAGFAPHGSGLRQGGEGAGKQHPRVIRGGVMLTLIRGR
jgi:hypothetical protein